MAMRDVGGKIARALQLQNGTHHDGGGLPLALGARAGHGRIEGRGRKSLGERWIWALELKRLGKQWRRMEWKRTEEDGGCFPFMGHRNIESPITAPQALPFPRINVPLSARGIVQIIDHIP
jgi:hypothetical protein